MPDVHLARIAYHRSLRRLAGELLPDYLPLSASERKLLFSGAAALVRKMAMTTYYENIQLTREAGHLFSRLPDDPLAALKTLDILAKLLGYIDEGVIDLTTSESDIQVIERAVVLPTRHLKLVEPEVQMDEPEHCPEVTRASEG